MMVMKYLKFTAIIFSVSHWDLYMVFAPAGPKEMFFNHLGSFGSANIKPNVTVSEALYNIVRI